MGVLSRYGDAIDRSEVYEILRNDRRRATIEVLRKKLGSVSLRALSEAIAERETGESPPPRNVRESVYNSLHQTHLPKLDERGVIEYDRDRKTVQLEDGAREVYVHMEVVNEYGITWADYYRSLGVLALMTIVAGSLGTPFLESIDPVFIASFYLVLFALSAARQLWVNRWLYLRALLPEGGQ
ncbi:DUF7344 domain-containing protein [Haloglomus litoreum]|uniref:DUF7344 domain-containing protein n=1 Tax=Haloglomus litoreum TaxID=3034026 RepID=UPI0023E7FEE8|nr:hypothetical protein [Haloglomus sp. DT116]